MQMTNDAPLKEFGQQRWKVDNKLFKDYNGFPLIVGLKAFGTWVNFDGKTYFSSGHIDYSEQIGYSIKDDDGGITPIKHFWTLNFETT